MLPWCETKGRTKASCLSFSVAIDWSMKLTQWGLLTLLRNPPCNSKQYIALCWNFEHTVIINSSPCTVPTLYRCSHVQGECWERQRSLTVVNCRQEVQQVSRELPCMALRYHHSGSPNGGNTLCWMAVHYPWFMLSCFPLLHCRCDSTFVFINAALFVAHRTLISWVWFSSFQDTIILPWHYHCTLSTPVIMCFSTAFLNGSNVLHA